MSLRTNLLRLQDKLLALTDPQHFDVTPTKLTIIKRTWMGDEVGADGGYIDTIYCDVAQRYELHHVSEREIAGSGGRYEAGTLKMGPISPPYYSKTDPTVQLGGYTSEQLKPRNASEGVEYIYRLTGQVQGDFELVNLHTEEPFEVTLYLSHTRTTP